MLSKMILTRYSGVKAGLFGGVALFTVIFLTSGVPKVYNDVLGVRSRPFNRCLVPLLTNWHRTSLSLVLLSKTSSPRRSTPPTT